MREDARAEEAVGEVESATVLFLRWGGGADKQSDASLRAGNRGWVLSSSGCK